MTYICRLGLKQLAAAAIGRSNFFIFLKAFVELESIISKFNFKNEHEDYCTNSPQFLYFVILKKFKSVVSWVSVLSY